MLYKIVDDFSQLKLNTINGQKTSSDIFTFNIIDKNNTIYNYIDLPDNRVYTLSTASDTVTATTSFDVSLSTQNIPNGSILTYTFNSFDNFTIDSKTGYFLVENNQALTTLTNINAPSIPSEGIKLNISVIYSQASLWPIVFCFPVSRLSARLDK